MIQLRNVSEELHRRLKARAALAGMSLSDYLIGEIKKSAVRPTQEEWLATLRKRQGTSLEEEPATAVRSERDSR